MFTGVLDDEEVGELTAEFDDVLDNVPTEPGGDTDRYGRPSPHGGYFSMNEDEEDPGAPARVSLLFHPFIYMESTLRVYAHPKILAIAESLYGPDFVPFHEAIFYKAPSNAFPTRWHQDWQTHWTEDGKSLETKKTCCRTTCPFAQPSRFPFRRALGHPVATPSISRSSLLPSPGARTSESRVT